MDSGKTNASVLSAPLAEPALDYQRITPELALVCPELAELARLRLPDRDPELSWLVGPRAHSAGPRPWPSTEPSVLIPKQSPWLRIPMRSRMLVAAGAAALGLLATGALTAAEVRQEANPGPVTTAESSSPSLVVPDVVGQPYVFAKQLLDDAGFAWEVEGQIEGYAANLVESQVPLPGTEIIGIELPRVTLTLGRNTDYEERGVPQNVSRDSGTPVLNLDPVPKPTPGDEQQNSASEEPNLRENGGPKKTSGNDAAADQQAVQPIPDESEDRAEVPTEPGASSAGNESALERSLFLASWILEHPHPTDEAVSYWLWQHSEIIAGARSGEPDAQEALEILVEIDRDLQKSWGVGAKSEALARETLQEIRSD